MALVESSTFMSRSEEKLMARARISLPPLPTQPNPNQTFASALALHNTSNPSLKRKLSPESPDSRPRKPFSYSTGASTDMETYHGHVRAPADAIILFEACRIGLLPRVQRRLSEKERQSIKSGSVFVWDEREAGMRRWTDGKSWSASRVSGSFLTYREMEGKRGGGGNGYPPPVSVLSRTGRTPDSTHGSESEIDAGGEEGPDGYRYKPDGLVKQSFSITTSSGNHLHLISYYSRAHPASQQLNCPSTDPQLRHIRPAKGMYPESTVHEQQNIPAVTRSPMAGAPYTTTPQMAGYARQGPPQWPQQQYAWPSGPPNHPQYQYYGYSYGQGPVNGPPPPSNINQHPPYGQSPQYSSSQAAERNYSTYDPRSPPIHAEHSPFDARRHRPPPPESQPLTHQNHTTSPDARSRPPLNTYQQPNPYANGNRDSYAQSSYDPQRYQNLQQAKEQSVSHLQSQLPQSNSLQQPLPSHQAWKAGPLPPPQSTQTPPVNYQHTQPIHPSSTPIDPQLMGTSPRSQSRPRQSTDNLPPSVTSNMRGEPSSSNASHVNGYQSAGPSTIPSIGALVNGSTPQNQRGVSTSQAAPGGPQLTNGYPGYTPNSEKNTASEGPQNKDGPPEYSGSKVGFGEDKRAINILDRGFKV